LGMRAPGSWFRDLRPSMPHVRRRVLVTVGSPADEVRAALERAAITDVPVAVEPGTVPITTTVVDETTSGTTVEIAADVEVRLPYFGGLVHPLVGWSLRRGLRHAGDRLQAAVAGAPEPSPPAPSRLLPPVPFTPAAAAFVATVCAIAALGGFASALFGQNADPVTDAFGASNSELGASLAVSRVGVLVSLIAAALADRRGRRRLLLVCFVGMCAANAVSALAPGFIVFTGAQLLTRAFTNAILVIAGIAVVEEAPDGARAWALAMIALAAGAGFACAVVLLPLSDLGPQTWRIAFGVSALTIVFLPRLARNLGESRRYQAVAARTERRGRVREVFDPTYGWRFVLVGLTAFLTNVFSAPAAQLTNRFLTDERGFSNTGIAIFRAVTNGLPGLLGIIVAGRLAETRGRRPLGVVALAIATGLSMTFFLGSGAVLWVTSTLGIVAAACAGLAIGAFEAELFPTEVRGTSNALLLVCAVAGSAAGLLLATNLDDVVGGLGRAIALCGLASLAAALLVIPFLPEPADRPLDEVSPSEV
jgi:MFS transporter, putative metabolite:H+ symporter